MHSEDERIDNQINDSRCFVKKVSDEKFHRRILSLVGPPLLERLIIVEESFPGVQKMFDWRYSNFVHITEEGCRKFKKMRQGRDEFGFRNAYQGAYSMNKDQRWLIPEQIRDEIASMQKPANGLRISLLESTYLTGFTGSKFHQPFKWQKTDWLTHSYRAAIPLESTQNTVAWHTVKQRKEIHRAAHGGIAGNLIWPIAPCRKSTKRNPILGHCRKCDREAAIAQLRSNAIPQEKMQKLEYWQLPVHVTYRTKEPLMTPHMVNTEYKRGHQLNLKSAKTRFDNEKLANTQLCIESKEKHWLEDNEPNYFDYHDQAYETQISSDNDWDAIDNALIEWNEVIEAEEAKKTPSKWTLNDFLPNDIDDFEFVKDRRKKKKKKKR